MVARLKLRSQSKADHLALIAVLWVAFTFWLLASSATKFHHYVFPVLPGLAILIALFVDRLWKDGPAEHAVSLIFGLVLFILVGKDLAENPKNFTDLFVYNYDRPYPTELVTKPIRHLQLPPAVDGRSGDRWCCSGWASTWPSRPSPRRKGTRSARTVAPSR